MLENTFCHFSGISPGLEKKLWKSNILNWNDLKRMSADFLNKDKVKKTVKEIQISQEAHERRDFLYFLNKLKTPFKVRLYPNFDKDFSFLDIETTGLHPNTDKITMISIFSEGQIKTFIRKINLEEFLSEFNKNKILVTFNGNNFDIPFIEKEFNTEIKNKHIDLLPVSKFFGIGGNLKKVEKQFGIRRQESDGIDGNIAIRLWEEYTKKDCYDRLLELVLYNIEDVIVLEQLLMNLYNLSMYGFPLLKKRREKYNYTSLLKEVKQKFSKHYTKFSGE